MPTLIEQRLAEREADTTERRPTLIEQRLAERGGKAPAPPRTVSDLDRALLEGPMPYAGPQQHEVEAQLLENPIERLQSERTGAAERRRALRHTIKSPDVNQSASLEYPSYLSREQLGWSTDAEDAEDTEDAPERRESPDDAIRRHIARIDQYAENIKRAKRAGWPLDFGGVASDTAYTDAELRAIAKWVKADWVPERRFADASIQTGDFTPAEAKRFLTIFKDLQQDKDVTAWVNTMRQRARNAATAHELSKRIHNVLWLPKNGVARAVWTGIGAASLSVAATASRSFNPRLADDINRLTHAQELAAGRMDMKSAFPAILLRGTRSATRSVITAGAASFTGMYGISLAFGATRYNDAMTEARDAGLGTGAARKYALRAAGIEAGIAMAFTRLGMGGFEKMMSGRGVVTKAGLKAFLRRTGVSLLHELPEENITELADNLNQALSEIEPQSLTLANTWATVRDTTISTIIAMGMGNVSAELGGRPAAKDITENVRTFIDKLPADTVARLAKVSTEGGVSRAVMPKVSKADWRLAVVNAAKERVAEEGIEETPAPKPAEGRAAITPEEGAAISETIRKG